MKTWNNENITWKQHGLEASNTTSAGGSDTPWAAGPANYVYIVWFDCLYDMDVRSHFRSGRLFLKPVVGVDCDLSPNWPSYSGLPHLIVPTLLIVDIAVPGTLLIVDIAVRSTTSACRNVNCRLRSQQRSRLRRHG